MPIQSQCACGQVLLAGDDQIGFMVRCPSCGQSLTVQSPAPGAVARPNYASAYTPLPGAEVHAPMSIPDNLRAPGLPVCYMIFSVEHAQLKARFDVSPALQMLAEGFAKKLRKQFDVQIVPTAPEGAPAIFVRLLFVDEGNRFLRYFLALFAGKTVLEIDGELRNALGQRVPFHEKHKGALGVFGGASIGLLKVSGKYLGAKLAKKLMKMG